MDLYIVFFFKQKTAYEMRISDWSSDVCSSDLHECLRQAVRARLHRVFDAHAPLRTIAEQTLEQCLLMRGVDDQHLADTGQHQHAERVVDHRLDRKSVV